MRLIMNEEDDILRPRYSAHFTVFDKYYNEVPLQKQDLWKEDWLGLRELYERGDLDFVELPGRHVKIDAEQVSKYLVNFLTEE